MHFESIIKKGTLPATTIKMLEVFLQNKFLKNPNLFHQPKSSYNLHTLALIAAKSPQRSEDLQRIAGSRLPNPIVEKSIHFKI